MQRIVDQLHHALRIAIHVDIPNSNDAVSLRRQPRRALAIPGFLADVRFAIEFQHQPFFMTVKINCVRSNRLLSAKLYSVEAPIAQQAPQSPLRRSHALPQAAGALFLLRREIHCNFRAPLPSPRTRCARSDPLPAGRGWDGGAVWFNPNHSGLQCRPRHIVDSMRSSLVH